MDSQGLQKQTHQEDYALKKAHEDCLSCVLSLQVALSLIIIDFGETYLCES